MSRVFVRFLAALVFSAAGAIATPVAAQGFDTEAMRLIGRFTEPDESGVRFSWPGSAMVFRFEGTQAALSIHVPERIRFWVDVDGQGRELWATPEQTEYALAEGLVSGPHEVRITRLAESFSGVSAFVALPETDGRLLPPPPKVERRLLVIGDSITAGYGVEGESKDCSYAQDTSTPLKAYAGIAASELGADIHTIAWSGIGAWRSYGETEPENPTIVERRKLTLGDDFDQSWNTAHYRPHAIILAIGTNDFWQGTAPGYRGAMKMLLADIGEDYPGAPVYLMVSPMLTGDVRERQAEALRSLETDGIRTLDLGRIRPEDGYGCDWHPDVVTQQRMADTLVSILRRDLNWE